jgi:type IV secretion system protein VirB9
VKTISAFLLATFACAAALGDVRPHPAGQDPRLQTVTYDAGQVVQLQGTPGYQTTILLSPGEQVQNVSVGDSAMWQVNVDKAGDHLFLKPTQAGAPTNMTVITNVRIYNFELVSLSFPTPEMAYTVQFAYPSEVRAETASPSDLAAARRASRYRITGDPVLRPSSVSDDGERTYVSWPADRPIPATFQIGDDGTERLANGGMRGAEFVIDGVTPKLVFRIDGKAAYAVRLPSRGQP